MVTTLKLTTVGNSTGLILPKELLEKYRLNKGDSLQITEVQDGFTLKPYDAEFARQMEIAEKVMRDNRDLLRRLAE